VGALAYKNRNVVPTVDDARVLLNEMITRPVENHVVEVNQCPSLSTAVLRASRAPSRFLSGVGFNSESGTLCFVFGSSFRFLRKASDPRELLESLLAESREPIEMQTYSRDKRTKTWQTFEPWEIAFIEETIMGA
jgi:hypothetical protein